MYSGTHITSVYTPAGSARQICFDAHRSSTFHIFSFHSPFSFRIHLQAFRFYSSCHLVVPEKQSNLDAWDEKNFAITFFCLLSMYLPKSSPVHKRFFPTQHDWAQCLALWIYIPHVQSLLCDSYRTKSDIAVYFRHFNFIAVFFCLCQPFLFYFPSQLQYSISNSQTN